MIMEKRVYSYNKHLRLTPEENKILSQKAEAAGMNSSSYLRYMIKQKPSDYPEVRDLLKELINEVNHIGVNINQIVKDYNSNFFTESEKSRLFAYMQKLNRKVDEAVKLLGSK